MTDNLLLRVEEKVMVLVTELENVRRELQQSRRELTQLRQDNAQLKSDKLNYIEKLQDLVSLLDSVDADENCAEEFNPAHSRMEAVGAN